jgi:hypothetical protein
MKFPVSSDYKFYLLFFLILLIVTCLPIWSVKYFVNQDGSAHLYNASLMLEILKGNSLVNEYYALNSISIPNSTGHWLMVLLLNLFSPFTVTKIMQTLTFAGFVAAVGWLRWQTVGRAGLVTSFLLGAVFAFNWLWFMGFYNFIIGVIGFIFTLGLYYRWRENMCVYRSIILAILLLIVYFSHLISFGMLAASLILLALFVPKSNLKQTLLWTFLAFLPVIPFMITYKLISESGGGIYPQWRYLNDPLSISSWISQLRGVDPFVLISRKRFPFSEAISSFFSIFSPIIWLLFAFILLSLPFLKSLLKKIIFPKEKLPFLILFVSFVFIALFSPDDFGYSHGSILRERIFICALVFFVPLFNLENNLFLKRSTQLCLLVVIIFQTLVVWDYAIRTNRDAEEFLSVRQRIPETGSIASVVIMPDVMHFHSSPMLNLNMLVGINKNVIVWDNYEIGYYIFPIVAKTEDQRQFVRKLADSNGFGLNNPAENFAEKLGKLDSTLEANHDKIETMLVWGNEPRIEAVLSRWFEPRPFFENGQVRLFRHK